MPYNTGSVCTELENEFFCKVFEGEVKDSDPRFRKILKKKGMSIAEFRMLRSEARKVTRGRSRWMINANIGCGKRR